MVASVIADLVGVIGGAADQSLLGLEMRDALRVRASRSGASPPPSLRGRCRRRGEAAVYGSPWYVSSILSSSCRARSGHPRLRSRSKTWMPGIERSAHDGHAKCARSAKAALRDWQDTIAAARLCNRGRACHNAFPPEYSPCKPPTVLAARASRAADPHSVAGADRRPRHRPLRLFAGAAGHARCAGLVVFRRGLHEHDQRRRLSRRRAGRVEAHQALRAVRHRALGNAGLRGVAGAVRAVGQFHRAEFCAAAGGGWRRGRLRRRRRAGGDDRAIAARAGELPAESVLRRTRARHPVVRPDRAVRAAGVRAGIVVDRVVGDDAALDRHDPAAAADAASMRAPASPIERRRNSRSGRC